VVTWETRNITVIRFFFQQKEMVRMEKEEDSELIFTITNAPHIALLYIFFIIVLQERKKFIL